MVVGRTKITSTIGDYRSGAFADVSVYRAHCPSTFVQLLLQHLLCTLLSCIYYGLALAPQGAIRIPMLLRCCQGANAREFRGFKPTKPRNTRKKFTNKLPDQQIE